MDSFLLNLLKPEVVWVTIPVLVIIGIFGKQMFMRYLSHKERMAKIEAGIDPDSSP